jgi:hypothetical protein
MNEEYSFAIQVEEREWIVASGVPDRI